MAAQPFCVLDASPTSVSSANSLRVYVVPSCRSSLETFNRTGASTNQPLRYTASHWLQTSLCSIGHHHPGLAIQPVFSPLHCSSIPLHQWLLYEDLTGDSVKGHAEVQVNNTYCSPLFSQASHFIVKIYQSSRSTMTSPWWCWLLLVTFLWVMSLEMVSRFSCSTAFMGLRWGWLAFSSLDPSSWPWRQKWHFPSYSLQALPLIAMVNERPWRLASRRHLPASTAFEGASCQDP